MRRHDIDHRQTAICIHRNDSRDTRGAQPKVDRTPLKSVTHAAARRCYAYQIEWIGRSCGQFWTTRKVETGRVPSNNSLNRLLSWNGEKLEELVRGSADHIRFNRCEILFKRLSGYVVIHHFNPNDVNWAIRQCGREFFRLRAVNAATVNTDITNQRPTRV